MKILSRRKFLRLSFMTQCDNPLWIFPNQDMGSAIVCNGLVRVLSRREKSIIFVTQPGSLGADIVTMFSDLQNVRVVFGGTYQEIKDALRPTSLNAVRLGFFSDAGFNWQIVGNWDVDFYSQAGIPFDERWNSFSLPAHLIPERDVSIRPDLVISHEVPERGILLRPDLLPCAPILSIVRMPSFWHWLPSILIASELHFVDSSYLNLAESLYGIGLLRGTKLVFHKYAKVKAFGSSPPTLRAPWIVL